MITQCFDWQDTFTECIVFPNSLIQSCLISMWIGGLGLISNFVCLWPLCTHWDLCSIYICLHIYNLQVTLDIMNTWFCCLYFLPSSQNWALKISTLNGHDLHQEKCQSYKTLKREDSWPFVLIHLVSQVYGGRLMLRVVFSVDWDHGTSASAHRPLLTGGNVSPSPESQHPGWPGPGTGGPVLTDWGAEEPLPTLGCHYNPCSLCPLPDTITAPWKYSKGQINCSIVMFLWSQCGLFYLAVIA